MHCSANCLYSILISFLFSSTTWATDYQQSQSEFEAYQRQSEREFDAAKGEFQLYKEKLISAFDEHYRQAAKIWGDKNTIKPSPKNWVSYQKDLQHRSVVDFERGQVQIAVAIDPNRQLSDRQAKAELKKTILGTLKLGVDNRSMIELAKQPIHVSKGQALLKGQIANQQGNKINESQYAQLADQAAAQAAKKTIRGNDGKARTLYTASLKLVSNHIRQRAQRYLAKVEAESKKHRIPAPLVLAIMETESMFNPMARSPAPAFGLMQLVPTAGAREAYRYLYKRDRIVSDTYLYNPDNNIQLGTAFINRLYYQYLAGIKHPDARHWATIAAYNTGAGNIFRTFAGKYSRAKFGSRSRWKQAALYEINKMSAEQVYQFLARRLPYHETRRYIKKVRSRIPKYQSI